MSSFTKPLIVKYLDGHWWELVEGFEYQDEDNIIKVPQGFLTDFASIPRIFWSIVGSPSGKYGKAAVIHDWLYATHTTTRRKADKIFREAMKVLKVKWWKRRLIWIAIRAFGRKAWNKHKKKEK